VPDHEYAAELYGAGGAVTLGDNYSARFTDTLFIGNSAPNGGAVHLSAGAIRTAPQAVFHRCVFQDNEAVCSPAPDGEDNTVYAADGMGGAIYAANHARVDLAGSLFERNRAWNPRRYQGDGGHGGAIAVDSRARLRVATSVFVRNYAAWAGGAVSLANWPGEGNGTRAEIYFSTLHDNSAPWGAGVNNYNARLLGRANIFHRNASGENVFSDVGNVTSGPVQSTSSISHSVFTLDGAAARNTGPGTVFPSAANAAIFLDPDKPSGPDGIFGNSDDGLAVLGSAGLPAAKVALPPDFADANRNGNLRERLPADAAGLGFPRKLPPLRRGAYQRLQ